MKISKTDPQTDAEMDMTPMIDIVFQLIIFFMLITDMTQKDLELLVLPQAVTATEDAPDPNVVRPIVNILDDGKIFVKRELLYDPDNDDQYQKVREYLGTMAAMMPKEPVNDDGTGPLVPANPLLIRADQSTPFKHIQKVMEMCGLQGIQIWKVQLAAAEDGGDEETPPVQ
jgi:biopolymer transport protein ExbD